MKKTAELSREAIIIRHSILGILLNILLSLTKITVGVLASSIAIVSEGFNNASDVLTSVLTLIGTKLAGMRPDKEHPFGHGRIEYLTSLVIGALILVTGLELLINSIKLIFKPGELSISYLSLIIVAVSALIKFFFGLYIKAVGKRADSGALVAVGLDSMSDSYASIITIAAALAFLIFDVSLDAYAGVLTSLIILKAGFNVIRDTVSDLLGKSGEKELATKLYEEILATEGILGAADMMLHDYGPEAYSGSVNVEIDHEKTVGEVYSFIHALQLRIMQEYKVTMVFGIYAVGHDHEEVQAIRRAVSDFVLANKHIESFHALYLEPETEKIYVDFIVDYKLRDTDKLEEDFTAYMAERFPRSELALTIETEFV